MPPSATDRIAASRLAAALQDMKKSGENALSSRLGAVRKLVAAAGFSAGVKQELLDTLPVHGHEGRPPVQQIQRLRERLAQLQQ